MSTILPHMMRPLCEFRIHAWNVLHAAHWNTGRKNYAKKSPSGHHRTICRAISSQLRHISTIGKILVIQQYLLHMFSQYGERRPTNGWDRLVSLASQQISKGFRVLASLLHRRRSTEINQTLHDVWPSPGLVHYIYCIYSFGVSCPRTEFCQVQNLLCIRSLALSYICSVTARHSISRHQPNFARGIFTRQGGHPVRHWAVELSSYWSVVYVLPNITEIIVSFWQLFCKASSFFMAALWNRAGHYIFALWFLSIFFLA